MSLKHDLVKFFADGGDTMDLNTIRYNGNKVSGTADIHFGLETFTVNATIGKDGEGGFKVVLSRPYRGKDLGAAWIDGNRISADISISTKLKWYGGKLVVVADIGSEGKPRVLRFARRKRFFLNVLSRKLGGVSVGELLDDLDAR